MIGDQTDGYVCFLTLFICHIGEFTDLIAQRLQRVHVEDRIHSLDNHSQPFQAHTGIYIFMLQLFVVPFAITLKLGKYIVPDFHIPVTVTSHSTSRFSAAVFLSAVIIYLRTGTAGACAMLPEVVLFAKTENAVRGDADLFFPDLKRFIIIQVNGRVQPVRIQSHHLGQKLPGPGNRILFKIIAK